MTSYDSADEDGPLEALMSVLGSFNCKDQINLNIVSSSFGSISVGDVDHAAVTGGTKDRIRCQLIYRSFASQLRFIRLMSNHRKR